MPDTVGAFFAARWISSSCGAAPEDLSPESPGKLVAKIQLDREQAVILRPVRYIHLFFG